MRNWRIERETYPGERRATPAGAATIGIQFISVWPIDVRIFRSEGPGQPLNEADEALARLAGHVGNFALPARPVPPCGHTPFITWKTDSVCRIRANPLAEFKDVEFRMDAPAAKSVKLVADFTDWEKSPLDMIRSHDGEWFTIVPLLPGNYAYRFLVDGRWFDDAHSERRASDSFGGSDTVLDV
ncbi:MAG: glycogen-binding domain-containing protein [Verrucomicrobia bacterium]|nr:glycogen-binding domain-containing protein [Verrucomicrobiota bacterium]MDE3099681.1 glycogen-binding domain-containing protein [Verrucomicrobiota bacterium]